MTDLAQTFQVTDNLWFYNAVDSRLYRVAPEGGELPRPTADVHFGCSEAQLRELVSQGPGALVLGVTEQCNLRCRYCVYSGVYSGERLHNDQRMSEEVALRGVDQFIQRNTGRDPLPISFFGGEPLTEFDLIQRVVAYAKERYPQRRFQFAMTTNATRLTGPVADYLRRERFSIGVSLDGPQAVHDTNRVFPAQRGSWEVVMRNLAAFEAADPEYYRKHVGILAVLSDPRRIAEIHEFFNTDPLVRDNVLLITPMRPFDADEGILPKLSSEEKAAYEEYLENLGKRFADQVASGCERPDHFAESLFAGTVRTIHGRNTQPMEEVEFPMAPCVPGTVKLFLSPNGTYYPCSNLTHVFPVGDLQTGPDPQKGLALFREFEALERAECSHCWAVRFCRACLLRARQGDRLSAERLREWCPGFLHQLERAFRIYISVASRDRGAWTRYYSTRPENPLESLAD